MTKAFESALRLLTRREHGAIELYDKLKRKGFIEAEVKEALNKCQDLGLQSDARFVENYSRSRIRQGYGPLKITQELKNKGIDSDLIHKELKQEEENWLGHALDVWQKKCRGQIDLPFPEIQKQQRFLLYRGFTMDTIVQVLRELK
ncbi:MAG: recombination regulator RecX [bacterium]|nr:recombination regulator RecX [bacterium]